MTTPMSDNTIISYHFIVVQFVAVEFYFYFFPTRKKTVFVLRVKFYSRTRFNAELAHHDA
jgi:hypothetical protein